MLGFFVPPAFAPVDVVMSFRTDSSHGPIVRFVGISSAKSLPVGVRRNTRSITNVLESGLAWDFVDGI